MSRNLAITRTYPHIPLRLGAVGRGTPLAFKDALELELLNRQIPFQREQPCRIEYKGRPLSRDYYVDFLCFDEVVLEIKARSVIGPADHAQVLNYLASTRKRCGLLLNFGTPKLEHRRFIWEPRLEI